MNPTPSAVKREKAIESLRWACVLPVAVLGSIAMQFIAAIVGRLAVSAWGSPAESTVVYYLLLLLFYIPKEAGFVVVGAKVAPQGRVVTAIVLAVMRLVMSLVAHVLRQPNPGVVNYTHFAVESTGLALGLAYLLFSERIRPSVGDAVANEDSMPPG